MMMASSEKVINTDAAVTEKKTQLTVSLPSPPQPFRFLKYSQLVRWKSYSEGETFGFTFMTLRDGSSGLPIHFVGRIDMSSPAYYSGLREFDQILQVNGNDVRHEAHKRVQQLIRESENLISLLTGDKESIKFLTDRGFAISDKSSDYPVQFTSAAPEPADESEKKTSVYRRFSLLPGSSESRTSPRPSRKKGSLAAS